MKLFGYSIEYEKVERILSICWVVWWSARTYSIMFCLMYHLLFDLKALPTIKPTATTTNQTLEINAARESPYSSVYRVGFHLGAVYREIDTVGVLGYSIYNLALVYYPTLPYFYHKFKRICEREFVVFLIDCDKSKQMTSDRLKSSLLLTLISNLNYSRSIIDLLMAKSRPAQDGPHHRLFHQKLDEAAALKPSMRQLKEFNRNIETDLRLSSEQLNLDENRATRRLIGGLRRQYQHLLRIGWAESSVCWPINRKPADRPQMGAEFLIVEGAFWISVLICGICGTALGHYLTYLGMTNNEALPEEMRRFSPAEKLMMFEHYIFIAISVYWFTSPTAMLIVTLKSQTKVLNDMLRKLKQFHNSLSKFNSFKQQQEQSDNGKYQNDDDDNDGGGDGLLSYHPGRQLLDPMTDRTRRDSLSGAIVPSIGIRIRTGSSVRNEDYHQQRWRLSCSRHEAEPPEQIRANKLRFECDKLAIEVYISLRMFLDEMEGPMKLAQLVLLRNLFFIFYCLSTTLLCFKDIKLGQLFIFMFLITAIVLCFDSAYLVCAIFSGLAIKIIREIFSLVAESLDGQEGVALLDSEQSKLQPSVENRAFSSMYSFIRSHPINEQSQLLAYQMHRSRASRLVMIPSELMHVLSDINYLSECPISPHTLQLWRRLASDIVPIQNRLICTVLGLLKLDYNSILRFNFWIISLILLALTWRFK